MRHGPKARADGPHIFSHAVYASALERKNGREFRPYVLPFPRREALERGCSKRTGGVRQRASAIHALLEAERDPLIQFVLQVGERPIALVAGAAGGRAPDILGEGIVQAIVQ